MESQKLAAFCITFAIVAIVFGIFMLSEMAEIKVMSGLNQARIGIRIDSESRIDEAVLDQCMISPGFPVKDGMELLMRHLNLNFKERAFSHRVVEGTYKIRLQCKEGC